MPPNPNHVSISAGLVHREGKLMKPDPRKGVLNVFRNYPIVSFKWSAENESEAIFDVDISAQGGANVFKLIGDPSKRVYMLKVASTGERRFFWMADPEASWDSPFCAKVNAFFTDTEPSQSQTESQHQSEGTSSVSVGQPGAGSGGFSGFTAEGLQQMIGQMIGAQSGPALSDVLSADAVNPILDSLAAGSSSDESELDALLEHLPIGMQTRQELRDTFRSPQFMQAIGVLTAALQQGQLTNVAMQCGLDVSKISPFGGVKEFLKALIDQAEAEAARQNKQKSDEDASP